MKFWIRIRYPASSCAGATRSFRQNRTPAGYAGRAQIAARIELTAAGTAEPRQITVRIGYALAMAPATGAPVRVAGPLMDQLAVRAKDDLVGQVTGDVPLHGNGGAAVCRACSPGTRRSAERLPDGQWASVKP